METDGKYERKKLLKLSLSVDLKKVTEHSVVRQLARTACGCDVQHVKRNSQSK
jgi:hypothetical protein